MSGTILMTRLTNTSNQVGNLTPEVAVAPAFALAHTQLAAACKHSTDISRHHDLYVRTALTHSQNFEKKDDIQYRLGIIHKQQKKYDTSLQVRFLQLPAPRARVSATTAPDVWICVFLDRRLSTRFLTARQRSSDRTVPPGKGSHIMCLHKHVLPGSCSPKAILTS